MRPSAFNIIYPCVEPLMDGIFILRKKLGIDVVHIPPFVMAPVDLLRMLFFSSLIGTFVCDTAQKYTIK